MSWCAGGAHGRLRRTPCNASFRDMDTRVSAPVLALAMALLAGCAPRVAPLSGVPTPALLPDTELTGHHRLVFRWEYSDGSVVGRGEGVARVAAPDSVRLDFFLDGGAGGGTAFLMGDSISAPGGALIRRLLPSAPLLWAALGRLAVPPVADTTARQDGGLLRVELGSAQVYRAVFDGGVLNRLERIDDGRLQEWVARPEGNVIEYRQEGAGRQLRLEITRRETVEAFGADVWSR